MRARARLGLVAVGLACSLGGCRVGRTLVSHPDDYAAYRRTRTRPQLEQRLRASEEYLRQHPDGAFVGDVRRAYARAEEALWISKRGSSAGLRAYLDALPEGPHAEEARRALAARTAASVDLLGQRAGETEQRLAAAAADRARARDELGLWLRRFSDEAVFQRPLADAPAELIVAWSLALPAPRCAPRDDGGRRCTKLIERGYVLPAASGGTASGAGERALVLEIVVDEDERGAVCAATIGGPAAFTRREEAASLEPGDAAAARERAVLAAASLVRSTMETRTGGDASRAVPCVEAPSGGDAPGAIDLVCGALRVEVRPSAAGGAAEGGTGGADDRVRISRASSCSGP